MKARAAPVTALAIMPTKGTAGQPEPSVDPLRTSLADALDPPGEGMVLIPRRSPDKVQTNLRLDADLHYRLRLRALAEGVSMNVLMANLIQQGLGEL